MLNPCPKSVRIGHARPLRQTDKISCSNVHYLLFHRICFFPSLGEHIFGCIRAIGLHKMTCFSRIDFRRGPIIKIKILPLLNFQNFLFGSISYLTFTGRQHIMQSPVLATAGDLSVCLSVCPSVRLSALCQNHASYRITMSSLTDSPRTLVSSKSSSKNSKRFPPARESVK